MKKKSKSMTQKLSEYTYVRPSMEKKVMGLKKSFGEINSMLTPKKKG